jgi:hypothetical protein
MITKWFLGVNAKSKGFFNGFGYDYNSRYAKTIQELDALEAPVVSPSFTKQSALASYNYDSEDGAIKGKKALRDEFTKEIKRYNDAAASLESHRDNWDTKSDVDKSSIISNFNLNLRGNNHYWYRNKQKFTQEELDAMETVDWEFEIAKKKSECAMPEAKIKFIDEKLLIREAEIEIKFMEGERRSIQWVNREANDTSGNYCCGCGGAVPDVPLLIIGKSKKQRYRDDLHICAICMSKLADEAKIQAAKVSQEILEHYQTDRFLRSMD